MIRNILLIVICFAIGLGIAYLAFGNHDRTGSTVSPSPTADPTSFSFSVDTPPSQSLRGTITSSTGVIRWQSRSATEPAQLTSQVPILQGEQVETGLDGRIAIQFPNASSIQLSAESSVYIAQTLPANLLFHQKLGTVSYQKLSQIPVSIRVAHLMIKQNSGILSVAIDEEDITISVEQGSATLAYNDLDYHSQIREVEAGQQVIFDDELREFD